jgi:hypothetical protein
MMSWQDYEFGPADDDHMTPEQAAEAGWLSPDDYSKAAFDVLAERQRQQDVEGWTAAHDDTHKCGEMALAAAAYAAFASAMTDGSLTIGSKAFQLWPWRLAWWKPKDPRRDLVRAGALIIAEIERLDRLAEAAKAVAEGGS